ncbi:MAG: hypothetical protein FD162_2998 [Rhodobacteraceae bacterium]|uniref:hypothetical protein n=1 Tax=Cypionkella sp. TaxID=2811411 RepID=UPI0013237306|nr:hypothetical protein [Cypionkella sp.]KAF0171466.1 MAG: hypothetical protein FD162_2998 [Paracoccaceae bacterium]MDO8325373.1 hypothetical protein [Cypionkella sp.]
MKRLIQPALLLAAVAFIAAPALTPPFTGYDPGMFPVQIDRPSVQPAGYAFAIWGLIYAWLLAHAVFGVLRRRGDPAFERTALPLLLASALGAVWLAIAASAPIWAEVVIMLMAVFALTAYLRADQVQDRWLLAAPTAIFAAWLTAASAVSTGVLLAGYGVLSDTASALAMLLIVLAIAVIVQVRRPRLAVYGATVTWAIIGIVVANWGLNPTVAYAALVGAAIMAAATGWFLRK